LKNTKRERSESEPKRRRIYANSRVYKEKQEVFKELINKLRSDG
jgi:hypothetical protein